MNAGVTTSRSLLDKPLNEITEEDISQLTREDCRRYLKEKGMRRPSWNKSQAIQQVISLKTLLGTTTNSVAGPLSKISVSPPVTWNSVEERTANVPPKSTPSAELGCRPFDTDNKPISLRSACATNWSVGQMTIFYCGKVNVYDGVPADKVRAIMHLATSPIHFPQDDPSGCRTAALWSSPCHLQTESVKLDFIPSDATISQTMLTEKITEYPQQFREEGNVSREPDVEGQTNRQVSLQRYLEKRKDRGRFKSRKKTGFSSSSFEMYLNHQMRTQAPNGQLSRSSTSSPPQPGPRTLCSSAENQAKNAGLSVDLNAEDPIPSWLKWVVVN